MKFAIYMAMVLFPFASFADINTVGMENFKKLYCENKAACLNAKNWQDIEKSQVSDLKESCKAELEKQKACDKEKKTVECAAREEIIKTRIKSFYAGYWEAKSESNLQGTKPNKNPVK